MCTQSSAFKILLQKHKMPHKFKHLRVTFADNGSPLLILSHPEAASAAAVSDLMALLTRGPLMLGRFSVKLLWNNMYCEKSCTNETEPARLVCERCWSITSVRSRVSQHTMLWNSTRYFKGPVRLTTIHVCTSTRNDTSWPETLNNINTA